MAHYKNLSKLLRKKRLQAGYSQEELAKKLGGVQKLLIANWERGLCGPSARCLEKLIEVVKIERGHLLEAMLKDAEDEIRVLLKDDRRTH